MKIKPIASNMTELMLNDGTKVLFSYQTPVACKREFSTYTSYYKTSKKWSVTTSKHINKWFRDNLFTDVNVNSVDQEYFDNLVKGA